MRCESAAYNQGMELPSERDTALQAIDELLATAGMEHGRRLVGSGYARQARHPLQQTPFRQERKAVAPGDLFIFQAAPLVASGVRHGFAGRTGGVSVAYGAADAGAGELNLGFTPSDMREHVIENRRRLLRAVFGEARPLVTLRQTHSTLIHRVGRVDAGEEAKLTGDGLMTDEPGIALGIQTADCVPVLLADPKRGAVAAFHAGRRGTLHRIVEHGVGRMRLEFGSVPEDLHAAIGPAIGPCCYGVGEEIEHEFHSQFRYAGELFCEVYDSDPVRKKYPMLFLTQRAPGHSDLGPSVHLDLPEANRRQLLDAGLRSEAISMAGQCTSCRTDLFFSHRAESGFTGRMLAVVGLS